MIYLNKPPTAVLANHRDASPNPGHCTSQSAPYWKNSQGGPGSWAAAIT